tara:strand:+ start:3477 stop:5753 length:2277 start_codon:yes stop_codon:yes gene_type:complete
MKLPPIEKSPLTNYQYEEHVDADLVMSILNQPELLQDNSDWDESQGLKKLLKFSKKNTLKVKYGYPKKGVKYFGRIQPSPWNSLGVMRNEIRGTLCYDKYVDMDIENAHLQLASQILGHHSLPNASIRKYCDNREPSLKNIMDTYNCSRAAAKDFYIKAIYGSSFKSWCDEHEITKTTEIKIWGNIKNEATALANHLIAENHSLFQRYIKAKPGKFNYKLGFLSKCLQHFEVWILQVMFNFWLDNNFIRSGPKKNCMLCHDGIMIKKNKRLNPTVYEKLNAFIFKETGFNLKIVPKEMKHYLDRIKKPEIPDCVSSVFDLGYMKSLPFYNNKKDYFEKYHAKILGGCRYVSMIQGNISYIKHGSIRDTYCNLDEKTLLNDDDDVKVGGKFIKKWLSDDKIRSYDVKEYTPYNGIWKGMNDGDIFNTFSGYSKHIHAAPEPIDDIKDIILNLCEGVPKYYDFFVRWLAHTIQYPNEKLPYAIITNGAQGTGKGFLFKLMESVLGDNCSTSDKIETYLGKHAVGIQNKVFINFNECSSSATRNLEAGIKSLITEDTTFIQPKYETEYEIRNLAKVWVTGNSQNTIKIDATSGERRFLAYRATEKYTKYDEAFWGGMFDSLKRPGVIAAWYQYLNNLDLSDYNFKKMRKECLSKTYYNIIGANTPIICSFLEDYIDKLWSGDDSDVIHLFGKSKFYRKYKTWHNLNGGEGSIYSSKRFWHLLINELQMPIKFKRTSAERCVEFNRVELLEFMKDKGWVTEL